MSSFTVKAGVTLPPVLNLAVVMAECFAVEGAQCIITSGTDGKHSANSLHYSGLALDFRTRHVSVERAQKIAAAARERLGKDYDVVVEGDHIHAEFDKKGV